MKPYTGITFEDTKELDPRKVHKNLGIEDSHDIQYNNEKEEFKKEHLRRSEISFGCRLKCKNKIQASGTTGSTSTKTHF